MNQTLNSQKTSIPYLALVDVYWEYFGKYWVCYNGATVPVLTHWPLGYLNENLDE